MVPTHYLPKLQSMIEELHRIRSRLDTSASECSGCGHKRYQNWNHFQADEAMRAAITRLDRVIQLLTSAKSAQEKR
jgi:uncharacterized protein YukE